MEVVLAALGILFMMLFLAATVCGLVLIAMASLIIQNIWIVVIILLVGGWPIYKKEVDRRRMGRSYD